jgi:hypothetical protein
MMDYLIVYDDREAITDAGRSFIGVERYSQLLHRKRTLVERIALLVTRTGLPGLQVVSSDQEAAALPALWERRGRRDLVIYLPSCLAPRDEETVDLFLRKIRHVQESFHACFHGDERAPLLVADLHSSELVLAQLASRDWPAFLDQHRAQFRALPVDSTGLCDLRSIDNLVEFLSTTFDARHFNAIRQDGYIVTKRSHDIDKMRREYRFFDLLPRHLRMYFLPPLDFTEDGEQAGYRIERLCVPDMAIQWIHGVMSREDFAVFLGRIRDFLRERPHRPAHREQARALYLGKCEQRHAALAQLPAAPAILSAYRSACPEGEGLDRLLARYRVLWERLSDQRRHWRACVSHGDLCFSNILYDRQSRLLKFIDPRGADSEEETWLDEYYDIAKLSHSICGGYDFINHDLVELTYSRELRLELRHAVDQQRFLAHREMFLTAMTDDGYDRRLIRLHEAALFLSMLPLHVDHPKKVVAFAMTARAIITELEG